MKKLYNLKVIHSIGFTKKYVLFNFRKNKFACRLVELTAYDQKSHIEFSQTRFRIWWFFKITLTKRKNN